MRRDAAEPERRDVLAQQRARLRRRRRRSSAKAAPRESASRPERAGAGEEIEHARAGDRIAIGVDEDVEQGLAQPVRGRPDRLRARRRERAPAQASADDAHQRALAAQTAPRAFAPRQLRLAQALGLAALRLGPSAPFSAIPRWPALNG